mgnify:CR=1 FL=1
MPSASTAVACSSVEAGSAAEAVLEWMRPGGGIDDPMVARPRCFRSDCASSLPPARVPAASNLVLPQTPYCLKPRTASNPLPTHSTCLTERTLYLTERTVRPHRRLDPHTSGSCDPTLSSAVGSTVRTASSVRMHTCMRAHMHMHACRCRLDGVDRLVGQLAGSGSRLHPSRPHPGRLHSSRPHPGRSHPRRRRRPA